VCFVLGVMCVLCVVCRVFCVVYNVCAVCVLCVVLVYCVHVLSVFRGAANYTIIRSWIKMKVDAFCELWCINNLKFTFITLKIYLILD
jgi:hypothetical protein